MTRTETSVDYPIKIKRRTKYILEWAITSLFVVIWGSVGQRTRNLNGTANGLLKQNSGDHTSHYASTEEVNSDISLSANMDALFDYTMTDADDMYAYMSNAR